MAYSRDSQWGVELSVLERLGSGEDIVPEFGLEAFYRPSKSVRFAVDLTDVVKLFSGKERVYAEPYARQSGAASVSVQFLY